MTPAEARAAIEAEDARDPLDTPLGELPLSIRLHNCLKNEGIKTLYDILVRPSGTWLCVPNLGRKSLHELREVAAYYGHALDALAPKPPPPTLAELRARLAYDSERNRAICRDWEAGWTQKTIAVHYGISAGRVSQILYKAARRRERLAAFDAAHQEIDR